PRCTADRNGGVDCGLTLQHTQAGEYRADLGHRSAARTEAEWLHSEGPFHGTCSSGGPLRRPEITIRTSRWGTRIPGADNRGGARLVGPAVVAIDPSIL